MGTCEVQVPMELCEGGDCGGEPSLQSKAWRDTMAILEDVAAPEATVLRGQSAISLTTGVPHHR